MTKLIATGTGRCGTHWLTRCLRQAGVPATQEIIFNPGRGGFRSEIPWVAEVGWPAAAYLPVDGTEVVHLVRHPLPTIASRVYRQTFGDRPQGWGSWAMEQCPMIQEGTTNLERSALHWVGWNRMIEPHADYMIRVEEVVPDDITQLARVVNPSARFPGSLPAPEHTSGHPVLTWEALADSIHREVYAQVADMAERYGY